MCFVVYFNHVSATILIICNVLLTAIFPVVF